MSSIVRSPPGRVIARTRCGVLPTFKLKAPGTCACGDITGICAAQNRAFARKPMHHLPAPYFPCLTGILLRQTT
jgi:hypothetical protein